MFRDCCCDLLRDFRNECMVISVATGGGWGERQSQSAISIVPTAPRHARLFPINAANPLGSIIVPVYNAERYLRYCIESILGQTYTNLEIILVDDGASDASPSICNEYAAKDNRITVIHQTNGEHSQSTKYRSGRRPWRIHRLLR